jgi:toxin HigB-1
MQLASEWNIMLSEPRPAIVAQRERVLMALRSLAQYAADALCRALAECSPVRRGGRLAGGEAVAIWPRTTTYHGISSVNLAFATLKLRSLCECQARAEDELGFAVAKQLRARMADLREVNTVLELPAGSPHEIPAKPYGNFAVNLAKGYRLVMRANHSNIPVLGTGEVDWAEVSRVMIIRIEDGDA